jgi:hypothetical protein
MALVCQPVRAGAQRPVASCSGVKWLRAAQGLENWQVGMCMGSGHRRTRPRGVMGVAFTDDYLQRQNLDNQEGSRKLSGNLYPT